jgi:hypothetical protein
MNQPTNQPWLLEADTARIRRNPIPTGPKTSCFDMGMGSGSSSPGAPTIKGYSPLKVWISPIQSSMVWLKGTFTGNPSFFLPQIQGFPAILPTRRWPCWRNTWNHGTAIPGCQWRHWKAGSTSDSGHFYRSFVWWFHDVPYVWFGWALGSTALLHWSENSGDSGKLNHPIYFGGFSPFFWLNHWPTLNPWSIWCSSHVSVIYHFVGKPSPFWDPMVWRQSVHCQIRWPPKHRGRWHESTAAGAFKGGAWLGHSLICQDLWFSNVPGGWRLRFNEDVFFTIRNPPLCRRISTEWKKQNIYIYTFKGSLC